MAIWPAVALLVCPAVAHAGEIGGTVKEVLVRHSDQLHYVIINGTPVGRPACAANTKYYMIRDENSRAGQSQLALLTSAALSGKTIMIHGAGTCNRWHDGEDIDGIMLVQ